jgi:peptidoglycan/LPS O-acetylase OafA/YrhL
MKRLFRRAFKLVPAVSAVLFIATCLLWIASYFVAQDFAWSDDSNLIGVKLYQGSAWICSSNWYTWPIPNGFFYSLDRAGHGTIVMGNAVYGKQIPLWKISAILLLAAALPSLRRFESFLARAIGEMRQNQLEVCTHCGYDLRATPHRCPECGAVPAGTKSEA